MINETANSTGLLNTADMLISAGNELIQKGNFRQARPHFEKLIKMYPNNAMPYCQMGVIQVERGSLEKAEEYFKLAVTKDKDLYEAYYNLGVLYQQKRQYAKALPALKTAFIANPGDIEVMKRIGDCLKALGKTHDAIVVYSEAFFAAPNNLQIGSKLASLYLAKNEEDKAAEVLKTVLQSHPKQAEIHFALGMIYENKENYESAMAYFYKSVSNDENNAEGFYHLGKCCIELDLLKQAEPLLAKAAKLDADFSAPVLDLGNLYFQQGKHQKAVNMLEHWVEMKEQEKALLGETNSDQMIDVYNKLGSCYAKLKQKSNALDWWNKSIQMNSDQPEIKAWIDKLQKSSYKKSLTIMD